MVQISYPYMTTGKTIPLTIWTFVSKVMPLLFDTASKVCHSFPSKEQAFLNFMAAVTFRSDFGTQVNKTGYCFHFSPMYLPWSDWLDAMILVLWMLSFKPAFPISSFTLIKRLFSSSLLSAIRVVSSAYLRLLLFLLAILIPACDSSSPAFHMMYSACKLNNQGDNIQPWSTPFLLLDQSIVPCPVLTIASWPAYRFLRRQVRWSAIPISSKNFPQFAVIHTVKGLRVVNETDVFLKFPFFYYDPIDVGNLTHLTKNHFSILALRTPLTVWKGKKIGHWKMNSPGQ